MIAVITILVLQFYFSDKTTPLKLRYYGLEYLVSEMFSFCTRYENFPNIFVYLSLIFSTERFQELFLINCHGSIWKWRITVERVQQAVNEWAHPRYLFAYEKLGCKPIANKLDFVFIKQRTDHSRYHFFVRIWLVYRLPFARGLFVVTIKIYKAFILSKLLLVLVGVAL